VKFIKEIYLSLMKNKEINPEEVIDLQVLWNIMIEEKDVKYKFSVKNMALAALIDLTAKEPFLETRAVFFSMALDGIKSKHGSAV
jgi:hypothetical protein